MTKDNLKTETKSDAEENKMWGILAYICFLIPLIAAPKDSKFSQYHTNQGLVLAIASIALNAVVWIISGVFSSIFLFAFPLGAYTVSKLFSALTGVLMLLILLLAIYGIINVTKGKMTPLPVIGKFNILK